ncbi:MAG: molybdopterin converting factor subunit 1 [Alphaproteobacteria bacterium]
MKILYFAWLKEKLGMAEEEVVAPETIATVQDLLDWMRSRGSTFSEALAEGNAVKVAVNHVYARPKDRVRPQDEIAFFPPVTGGWTAMIRFSAGPSIWAPRSPPDPANTAGNSRIGAVVSFLVHRPPSGRDC